MLVELRGVSVLYPDGSVGLSAADFRLQAGELVVVTGVSGAGKSTFLAAMSGRLPATTGSVLLDGVEVGSMPAAQLATWRRKTAFVAQAAPMLERRSVAENAAYSFELGQPGNLDSGRKVLELLEMLGIAETAARRPSELSGGQRQRAALAQGLAKAPTALFLDEPTANLDRGSAALVEQLISARCQSGMACVVASHDQAAFASLKPRRLWVSDGRVSATASGPYTALANTGP